VFHFLPPFNPFGPPFFCAGIRASRTEELRQLTYHTSWTCIFLELTHRFAPSPDSRTRLPSPSLALHTCSKPAELPCPHKLFLFFPPRRIFIPFTFKLLVKGNFSSSHDFSFPLPLSVAFPLVPLKRTLLLYWQKVFFTLPNQYVEPLLTLCSHSFLPQSTRFPLSQDPQSPPLLLLPKRPLVSPLLPSTRPVSINCKEKAC